MWNEDSQFIGVYKEGVELSGMGGCTPNTAKNLTDSTCCCVQPGENTGHYVNFTVCPAAGTFPPPSPGNATQCLAEQQVGPRERHSSTWPCNKPVSVRELLGLGPAYYHGVVPAAAPGGGATKFDGMWKALFDDKDGFWAEYGPTTVERRSTCFNNSLDTKECNWAGPSWPYETSRVLTGLSRFLIDYPASQSASAGMTAAHYTKLLRTYARSMTQSTVINGSVPWVGENIEPDKGYWVARSVMYRGGQGTVDPLHPWIPVAENPRVQAVNCSACKGTCYDRDWSSDGQKCWNGNTTLFKMIDPCDVGCSCVPPSASYDYLTHSTVACCHYGPPMGSCDGKRQATSDKDRGKDYNHSTFLDLIIEGLIGLRATFSNIFVVQPLADASIKWFALDNLAYHGHDVTVVWDPDGAKWGGVGGCKGLCVFVDGKVAARSDTLARLTVTLPKVLS
jgi:hypothetical protein